MQIINRHMKRDLPNLLKQKISRGFTLIELLVVIAILGVLAVLLITVIDPLDKIDSANDAGVISSVAQFGKAEDGYAAGHNNFYTGGTTINAALGILKTAGESKNSTYSPPSGYAVTALESGTATPCVAGTSCTDFAFYITLKSKKYTSASTPIYQYVNGKGCTVGTAITQAQLDALDGASTGAGAC